MTLLDVAASGTPMAGAAVYLWRCNSDGHYSMYDQDIADENYLRGMQESDSDGKVRFTSIFPAAYAPLAAHPLRGLPEPRRRHIRRLQAEDLADRPSQGGLRRRLRDKGYEQSGQNLAQTSLDTDMVFSDGYASQLATTSGTVDSRITIKLNVGV
jgi:protocatechuate 3,4-dioxygenase beta subunit